MPRVDTGPLKPHFLWAWELSFNDAVTPDMLLVLADPRL